MEIRRGLHLRYEGHRGTTTIRLKGYRFDGKQWCTTHNFAAPRGRIFVLGCDCGAQDWQDNGRDLNAEHVVSLYKSRKCLSEKQKRSNLDKASFKDIYQ